MKINAGIVSETRPRVSSPRDRVSAFLALAKLFLPDKRLITLVIPKKGAF
jgi:hypothetical protein